MYFKEQRITLENIPKVLKGYSLDIQDEVRSMLLDGVDLSKWIDVCRQNPYRLNQIRLSVKEGVDPVFFNISSGAILYKLRSLLKTGFSGEELLPYLGKGFTEEQWNYILSWAERGLLDKRLNLVRTPWAMWSYIDKGLTRNLPMWLFTDGKVYSDSFMHSVMVIMSNGKPVDKFLKDVWSEDVVKKMAEFSYRRWYDSIEGSVRNFITLDFLESVGELAREGVINNELTQACFDLASQSYVYAYQSYHLDLILKAVQRGYDYSPLMDYELSYSEAEVVYRTLEVESKRSFSGRL